VEFARGLECELADANSECGIRNDEVTGLMEQLAAERKKYLQLSTLVNYLRDAFVQAE